MVLREDVLDAGTAYVRHPFLYGNREKNLLFYTVLVQISLSKSVLIYFNFLNFLKYCRFLT